MPAQTGPDSDSKDLLECFWLGVPRISLGQKDLTLVSRNALQLFAYLSLEGPTHRSKMASLFWSDSTEESARRNLRSVLYRLRESELGSFLIAEGNLLQLRDPWVSDTAQFLQACAVSDYENAIRIYRGPLLDGLVVGEVNSFESWLEVSRERFARAYREALLALCAEAKTQGDYRRALQLNLRLLEQDDLQERVHAEIMRLHVLLGEREAALARFEQCRKILEEEIGVEPLPETLELAKRIREVPVLEVAPGPKAQTPISLDAPLVGRDELVRHIRTSPATVVAVLGEPGVGKTRLLENCTHPQALWLRFPEAAQQTPLYALAQAIRQIAPRARQVLASLEPAYWQEVLRLVPELEPGFAQPEGDTNRPEWRTRFLEAMVQALRGLSLGLPGRRSTIVLDDLHWADPMTFEVLGHLLGQDTQAIQLLASIRAEELDHRPALRSFLNTLERQGKLKKIWLEPFDEQQVLQLVQTLSGAEGGSLFSRRLHQATGGNALFVLETLRHLLETKVLQQEVGGGWFTPFDDSTADYAELPIPPSVREAVLERVNRLGMAAKRLLEAASLSENTFELQEVASATALSDWEGVEVLEHSVQARILLPQETGYAFAHDLARRSLIESMSPERRRLVHLKLAQSLITLQGVPARIASHLEQAASPQQAVPWRIKAAEAATRIYAHTEALEQYNKALQDGASDPQAFAIHQARLKLLHWLDDKEQQLVTFEQMEQLARRLDNPQLHQVWLAQAEHAVHRSDHARALELCQKVLAQTQPGDISSEAHRILGFALRRLGNLEEAATHLQQALGQSPEQPGLRHKINVELARIAERRNAFAQARTYFEAASQQASWSGDKMGELSILSELANLSMRQGDAEQAITLYKQALEQARIYKISSLEGKILRNLGSVHSRIYRLDEALSYLEQGLRLARTPHDPYVEGLILNNMAAIHYGRAQLGLAIEKFGQALEVAKQAGLVQNQLHRQLTLGEILIDIGDLETAQRHIEQALELMQKNDLLTLETWAKLCLARIELTQGNTQQAQQFLDQAQASNSSDPEDQFRLRWLRGLSQIAQGQPQGVAALVQGQTLKHHRARLLALQLRAQTQLGLVAAESLEQARTSLSQETLGPFDRIDLTRALTQALQDSQQNQEAFEVLRHLTPQIQNMAYSLEAFPQLQHSFVQQYHDLLAPQ